MPVRKTKRGKPEIDIKVRGVDKMIKADKKGKDVCVCCGGIKSSNWSSCSGCGYFLGFIGAVVYYLSTATGFWMGVLGVLKAIVWPAFLVFEVLKFVGA